MASVFASTQTFNGGFRADFLKFSLAGQDARGMIVQNVQFQYNQQVSLLYEVGSEFAYYIGGRANGNATFAYIVGPAKLSGLLLTLFRDLCSPKDISLSASAGCSPGTRGAINYELQSAVMVGISGTISAEQAIISQNLQFMFINMDVSGGSIGGAAGGAAGIGGLGATGNSGVGNTTTGAPGGVARPGINL